MKPNKTHPVASQQKVRCGFTLIEMLVAASLSALMIVTVMGVLAGVSRRVDTARANHDLTPWHSILENQLQAEFAHCRSVLVQPDRLVFDGYAAVDRGTGVLQRLPSKVTYRITAGGGQSWLVRREQRLDIASPDDVSDSLVCFGVSRFQSLTRLETDVPPGQLHLRISFGNDTPPLETVLHRHGGQK